ncbi:MAG: DsbA family protein [Acidobacteria bacterium]|nr:DsbA family protein [Acidobacteriota bacterium]MCA1639229.1 DsbA family protein [Acidobacteriota bacterium]
MKNVENKKNNSSSLPLAIIGLVLLAAVIGGWWFYSTSKPQPKKLNTNSANKKTPDDTAAQNLYAKAPPGAQPPNMLGSPNAPVVVEEFADFQCPTCATVHATMKEINTLYGNRIKFIYRNFPLSQIHKYAYDASAAAEAAGLQGKYWAMQEQLFGNQKTWSNSPDARKLFEEYAQKIGLDLTRFQNDSATIMTKSRIDADIQRARFLNLSGTPTIFINGREVTPQQMDVSVIRQIIDAELQKASSQSAGQATSQTSQNQTATGSKENSNKTK